MPLSYASARPAAATNDRGCWSSPRPRRMRPSQHVRPEPADGRQAALCSLPSVMSLAPIGDPQVTLMFRSYASSRFYRWLCQWFPVADCVSLANQTQREARVHTGKVHGNFEDVGRSSRSRSSEWCAMPLRQHSCVSASPIG